MSTKLLLPLDEMPGHIRESLRTAMKGAKVTFSKDGRELSAEDVERMLDRAARNITQGLFAIDETPDDITDRFDNSDSDAPRIV